LLPLKDNVPTRTFPVVTLALIAANTLAWMIHMLWQHPQALQRATDEVRNVVADRARRRELVDQRQE